MSDMKPSWASNHRSQVGSMNIPRPSFVGSASWLVAVGMRRVTVLLALLVSVFFSDFYSTAQSSDGNRTSKAATKKYKKNSIPQRIVWKPCVLPRCSRRMPSQKPPF